MALPKQRRVDVTTNKTTGVKYVAIKDVILYLKETKQAGIPIISIDNLIELFTDLLLQ